MNNAHLNPDGLERSPEITDLSWLAFCYVANELDAKVRRQFEIRLEEEQTARDAVVEALDGARMLNLALSPHTSEPQEVTGELPTRKSGEKLRLGPVRSNSKWLKVLVGTAVAGLLAIVLTQLWQKQATVELVQSTRSLAEAWADLDWEADMQVGIVSGDDLTDETQLDYSLEQREGVHQDDWMTATLIDMAQDLSSRSSGSGS